MILSKNTKDQMIVELIKKYGKNYKTPLAKDLRLNVSTVRRMFNNDKELRLVNEQAILRILSRDQNN